MLFVFLIYPSSAISLKDCLKNEEIQNDITAIEGIKQLYKMFVGKQQIVEIFTTGPPDYAAIVILHHYQLITLYMGVTVAEKVNNC